MAQSGAGRRPHPGLPLPAGTCPQSHTPCSLLPDCVAARLPGTLPELETAADQVGRARLELPGATRGLRRRVRLGQQVLRPVIGLLPQHLAGCRAELTACRQRLDSKAVW